MIILTCSILFLSCVKLLVEKALNVPPMVTESGITLKAPPPSNLATVTTCKHIAYTSTLERAKEDYVMFLPESLKDLPHVKQGVVR